MLNEYHPSTINNIYSVAVLIPAYNCQESLILTLKSFDNSFPIYVLIIDDGSNIPVKINEPDFYPHKIEVYYKKKNSGIEETLNLGVEIIHKYGFEFFARIDAGDTCKNNRFKLQYEYLKNNSNLSWIGGAVDMVEANTRNKLFSLILPNKYSDIKKYFFMRSCYIHPALMFRTKHVINVGNYTNKYIAAEDMDLILRLMHKYNSSANLKDIILDYEVNPYGISSRKRKIQIKSTLRLQIKYYDLVNIYWYLGLIKNIVHLIIAPNLVYKLKSYLFNKIKT